MENVTYAVLTKYKLLPILVSLALPSLPDNKLMIYRQNPSCQIKPRIFSSSLNRLIMWWPDYLLPWYIIRNTRYLDNITPNYRDPRLPGYIGPARTIIDLQRDNGTNILHRIPTHDPPPLHTRPKPTTTTTVTPTSPTTSTTTTPPTTSIPRITATFGLPPVVQLSLIHI